MLAADGSNKIAAFPQEFFERNIIIIIIIITSSRGCQSGPVAVAKMMTMLSQITQVTSLRRNDVG